MWLLRRLRGRENTRVGGELRIVLYRGGRVVARRVLRNMVVNAGLAHLAGLVTGLTTGPFTHMALGTSDTPPAPGQTALGAEITTGGGARGTATVSRATRNVTNDTAQWVRRWTFTAPFAITESGIFNAPSGGVMLSRRTFPVINVEAGDELEITWQVWFERG